LAALRALAPLGVAVVLGALEAPAGLPLVNLINGNRALIGSVQRRAESFAAAVRDLARLDGELLDAMVRRAAFGDFEDSSSARRRRRSKSYTSWPSDRYLPTSFASASNPPGRLRHPAAAWPR